MSETDNGWDETSVAPPPPVTDGRPVTTRAKRDSLRSSLRTQAKRLVPLLGTLIAVLVTSWTMRLQVQVEAVQDRADGAAAKGEKGERVAKVVKVETAAFAGEVKEKTDDTGEDVKKLMDRLNVVEAELAVLRAKAGRPKSKRKPLKPSPKTAVPLSTPAAAAAQEHTP